MKTSKIIKLCTITILEIALFQPAVAAVANSPIPNYADDNEDCIRALYQITTQAEKSCGDISDNDIKVLRTACFCAPIQGNAPSGQCTNSENDAELNINTQNHKAFFELSPQNSCPSEQYITDLALHEKNYFHIIPNFCTNKVDNNGITKNNAWLHKSSFNDGKTEITMDSLRERLINTSCNRIIAIDDQTSLNDPYPYKLYVALNDDLILSKEIKLSDSNEPAIIFGKNITITGNEEQRKLAHILAYGTLNINNGNEFIGGLNANKLNYTFTTDNTKQKIITSIDLTGGECRLCSKIQKAEANAFRLSQISGQNACEQIILQLEKCTSGNSECTPYKENGAVVTITKKDGTSTTKTTDENGRINLSNSTFSASLGINNQATKVYCDATTNTLSDSCTFSGNICTASINDVGGYVGETLPVEIKIQGDVRDSFKASNDNTADSTDTVIKVYANVATTQNVSITNIDGTKVSINLPPNAGTTTPINGDIVLPNATISYDEPSNQTIIKSTLVVNTLALDREPKTTYFNFIKLEVQNKNPVTGETPEEFIFDFRQETTKPKIRTAPVAVCLNVDNKTPSNLYLLESDRAYDWTQKAVGCTNELCKANTTPVDQNIIADQKTLSKFCDATTDLLPHDVYDDWQREGALTPLYKTTFDAWYQTPSDANVITPSDLATEDSTLKSSYEALNMYIGTTTERIKLGFTGIYGSSATTPKIRFTNNGWISASTYNPINTIPERKTYFYSPVYTVVPVYLTPANADIFNYYSLTKREDLTTVPDDFTTVENINKNNCPQYYNEKLLLRLKLNGRSATDEILTNIRGSLVDNTKNEVDFVGFSVLLKDEPTTPTSSSISMAQENEANFSKLKSLKNWDTTKDADGFVSTAFMTADNKFSLLGTQEADPKTVFLGVLGRTKMCLAPQEKGGAFTCNYDVFTRNEVAIPEEDTLQKGFLASAVKSYYGLSVDPIISLREDTINGLSTPWKNYHVTFLPVSKGSGPLLKSVAFGRLVSLPVTGKQDTLYLPFTIQYLDQNGNWKVRKDQCTTLNLVDYTTPNLPPNMFFKTAKKDGVQTDKNGVINLKDGEEVQLGFCTSHDKNSCNATALDGNFGAGILWLKAEHQKGTIDKDSYGLLDLKFNPGSNDNKNIDHLLDKTTSQGGFLFKQVKNNLRIINETRE